MNIEKILDSSFMDLKEVSIEYLMQIAKDTQRDLSIECSAMEKFVFNIQSLLLAFLLINSFQKDMRNNK